MFWSELPLLIHTCGPFPALRGVVFIAYGVQLNDVSKPFDDRESVSIVRVFGHVIFCNRAGGKTGGDLDKQGDALV